MKLAWLAGVAAAAVFALAAVDAVRNRDTTRPLPATTDEQPDDAAALLARLGVSGRHPCERTSAASACSPCPGARRRRRPADVCRKHHLSRDRRLVARCVPSGVELAPARPAGAHAARLLARLPWTAS